MARLLVEKTFLQMAGQSERPEDFTAQAVLQCRWGNVNLKLSAEGEPYRPFSDLPAESEDGAEHTTVALLISSALVSALGKLPPLPFLHKTARFLPLPFSLCNSTACIPATLTFCGEKLGLREDFVKFSIPVGMQLNMDGTAFYVAITSMMLARTFHLTQDAYFFAAFFCAQFFLALTGIGFIAMPSMFVAFGIPEVAIATVIGIEPILDMCGTAQSVLGNITSSLLVGRRLGQVDEKTYGSADT